MRFPPVDTGEPEHVDKFPFASIAVDATRYILRTMRFEHRHEPLLDRMTFLRRQLKFLAGATLFIGVSLALGTAGYMHFAGFAPTDAFLNASMILSGMGPVGALPNEGAKYFASIYALYSSIALMGTVAVMLAPLAHRLLHALHLEDDAERAGR